MAGARARPGANTEGNSDAEGRSGPATDTEGSSGPIAHAVTCADTTVHAETSAAADADCLHPTEVVGRSIQAKASRPRHSTG
jgi:hypothetical protein